MRARIHLIGTERVVWKEAEEAARLVSNGLAEYAGDTQAPEADIESLRSPDQNKTLRPVVEDKRRRR